jgi:hypothetical protein
VATKAGPAGDACADTLLETAVAELDQTALVEAHHRDAAPLRLVDQRLRGRAVARAADQPLQVVEPSREVELAPRLRDAVQFFDAGKLVGQQRVDEFERDPAGEQPTSSCS